MKNQTKLLTTLITAVLLAGCASPTPATAPAQATQIAYVQACAAYSAVFATALQLRKAGKLNEPQLNQVTLLDSQVTPICTGALPADPDTATQQITAAVTALTILEAVQKAN